MKKYQRYGAVLVAAICCLLWPVRVLAYSGGDAAVLQAFQNGSVSYTEHTVTTMEDFLGVLRPIAEGSSAQSVKINYGGLSAEDQICIEYGCGYYSKEYNIASLCKGYYDNYYGSTYCDNVNKVFYYQVSGYKNTITNTQTVTAFTDVASVVSSQTQIDFNVTKIMSEKSINRAKQIAAKAQTKGDTNAEKMRWIYAYLTKKTTVTTASGKFNSLDDMNTLFSDSSYNCLIAKKSDTEGIACAISLVARCAGIPCVTVSCDYAGGTGNVFLDSDHHLYYLNPGDSVKPQKITKSQKEYIDNYEYAKWLLRQEVKMMKL